MTLITDKAIKIAGGSVGGPKDDQSRPSGLRPCCGRNDFGRGRGQRSASHQPNKRLHRHLVGFRFRRRKRALRRLLRLRSHGFRANELQYKRCGERAELCLPSGRGWTVSSPTPTAPYPSTVTATYSGDGSSGFWGWQYNTAAGASGSGLPLTYGRLGEDATLNFDVGGFDDSTYAPPIGYYVFVTLPGDWTTPGTSPGDYIFTGVNPIFSTPTFTYDSGTNTTTVESFTTAFVTGEPSLSFTLVGSVVPEASTWAMMLTGFAGLGFAGYRTSRKAASVAA